VERRVLGIPDHRTYITVEPEQTAASYTAGLRLRYIMALELSAGYLLVYLLVWFMIWRKNKKRKEGLA
jgi:hypothetical protein